MAATIHGAEIENIARADGGIDLIVDLDFYAEGFGVVAHDCACGVDPHIGIGGFAVANPIQVLR
jgi:hypothetical protein